MSFDRLRTNGYSFDGLRRNGKCVIPFVVSLSNHLPNRPVQRFLQGSPGRDAGACCRLRRHGRAGAGDDLAPFDRQYLAPSTGSQASRVRGRLPEQGGCLTKVGGPGVEASISGMSKLLRTQQTALSPAGRFR